MRAHKAEIIIFLTAFILRAVAFGIFFSTVPDFPMIGSDSTHYVRDAERLLEFGRFLSQDMREPNSYETPVYPAFLALMLALFRNLLLASLLQSILAGVSAVLIFRIAAHIFTKSVGVFSALLFALDPIGIFYTNYIVTEPLFIFLSLVATLALIKKMGFLGGLALGLTTLVRPVGVVFLPFFLLYPIFKFGFVKQSFRAAIMIFLGFILVVGPWMLRNKVLFDRWELSVVASWQFYHSHAPHFYAYMNGIPEREAELIFVKRLSEIVPEEYRSEVLREKAGSLRHSQYMWQVSFDYIKEHPFNFAVFHAIKTLPFFLSDGLGEVARDVDLVKSEDPSITAFLLKGDFKGVREALLADKASFAIFLVGFSFWFLMNIFMIVGFVRAFVSGSRAEAILFACFILATAVVAGGAVAHPRYRYSVSPFIFILAVLGASELFRKYATRNKLLAR